MRKDFLEGSWAVNATLHYITTTAEKVFNLNEKNLLIFLPLTEDEKHA